MQARDEAIKHAKLASNFDWRQGSDVGEIEKEMQENQDIAENDEDNRDSELRIGQGRDTQAKERKEIRSAGASSDGVNVKRMLYPSSRSKIAFSQIGHSGGVEHGSKSVGGEEREIVDPYDVADLWQKCVQHTYTPTHKARPNFTSTEHSGDGEKVAEGFGITDQLHLTQTSGSDKHALKGEGLRERGREGLGAWEGKRAGVPALNKAMARRPHTARQVRIIATDM